jgi:hypothetical protein
VFYEGRSGKPYSWTFKNDMNGDGISTNDLMYIPKAFGSGEVTFAGDSATSHANEQRFWDIVNANKALKNSAGGVVGRYSDFAPWTNSFDVKISQEIPGLFARNKGQCLVRHPERRQPAEQEVGPHHGNAVLVLGRPDPRLRRLRRPGCTGPLRLRSAYPERRLHDRQNKGESQWAAQVTVNYEF